MEKLVKKKDSTEDSVREKVNKEHVCEGHYKGHHWKLGVGSLEGDKYYESLPQAVCRFNDGNPSILGFWPSSGDLESYMHKRVSNISWVEMQTDGYRRANPKVEKENPGMWREQVARIERQQPYPAYELSSSAVFAIEMPPLEHLESLIDRTEKALMSANGNLPSKPTIIGLWQGTTTRYQPILRVEWKEKEGEKK